VVWDGRRERFLKGQKCASRVTKPVKIRERLIAWEVSGWLPILRRAEGLRWRYVRKGNGGETFTYLRIPLKWSIRRGELRLMPNVDCTRFTEDS